MIIFFQFSIWSLWDQVCWNLTYGSKLTPLLRVRIFFNEFNKKNLNNWQVRFIKIFI